MANDNRCPQCGSGRVKMGYPDLECLHCGYSEPLTDYTIGWDWRRSLCSEFDKLDPGPIESHASLLFLIRA